MTGFYGFVATSPSWKKITGEPWVPLCYPSPTVTLGGPPPSLPLATLLRLNKVVCGEIGLCWLQGWHENINDIYQRYNISWYHHDIFKRKYHMIFSIFWYFRKYHDIFQPWLTGLCSWCRPDSRLVAVRHSVHGNEAPTKLDVGCLHSHRGASNRSLHHRRLLLQDSRRLSNCLLAPNYQLRLSARV